MFSAFNKVIFQPLLYILSYNIHIFEFTFSIIDILFFGFWCIMLGLIIKVIVINVLMFHVKHWKGFFIWMIDKENGELLSILIIFHL